MERAKETIRLVERASMLCPTRNDFKLFLARGLLCSELSFTECGLVSSSSVTTMDGLVEAACLQRDRAD